MAEEDVGVAICQRCSSKYSKVTHTRPDTVVEIRGKRITVTKRRRLCRHCGYGWWTIERREEDIIRDEDVPLEAPPSLDNPESNPYL